MILKVAPFLVGPPVGTGDPGGGPGIDPDATRLLPLLRNGGAEMARLGDQASVLGAVLDGDALEALRRTQLALGTVSLVFDGLRNRIAVAAAPTIEALANVFVTLASDGGILRSAIEGLIGTLGRLASYAATFPAVMTGRWVAGFAVAALSVRGLATALVFLRGALIRTGIGALIVGAGELVYQFSQLVTRVGGVGEAFRLLGDLAKEVWSRIGLSLDAAFADMTADWEGLKAAGLSALESTIAGVVSFGDRTAAIFQGAYDAAVAIWGSLPGAIGDFAFQAANGLISGVEAMLERRRHPDQQLHQRSERRAGAAARMGDRRRRGADLRPDEVPAILQRGERGGPQRPPARVSLQGLG